MSPRIFRFLISGGSAAALEYLVFIGLQQALGSKWLIASQSISFACGFVVSFLLNRHWVFRSGGNLGSELARYGALAAINLVLGNVAMALLVTGANSPPLLAKLIVMVMIAVWNYVIFSKLIFRQPPPA